MTLEAHWEEILGQHDLSMDRADMSSRLARISRFTGENPSEAYDRHIQSLEGGLIWLEPSAPAVPVRIVTEDELAAMGDDRPIRTWWSDPRTCTRHVEDHRYDSEVQARRQRGRHHSEETRRKISAANRKIWSRLTPEQRRAKALAGVGRVYRKCAPACPCWKHSQEVGAKRRTSALGKEHNVSEEGKKRQDIARRLRRGGKWGQMRLGIF